MKGKKILIIGGVVVLVLFLFSVIGVGAVGLSYLRSPQRAYLEFSNAYRAQDSERLSKLVDCDSLKKNYLDGVLEEAGEGLDCDEFVSVGATNEEDLEAFFDAVDDKALAKNIVDAYRNDYFNKKGGNYELELNITPPGEEQELEVTYVFGKVDGKWKIIDIDLGTFEEFIKEIVNIGNNFQDEFEDFTLPETEFNEEDFFDGSEFIEDDFFNDDFFNDPSFSQ